MDDAHWMGAALALADRGRAQTVPNPNVGCVLVRDGKVVGRGWTAPGGRPHAEAVALAQAGDAAKGATTYVTLEPCAHESPRGPCCTDLLINAGIGRVVSAMTDPDPRTAGRGIARLEQAGIAVTTGIRRDDAARVMAGWLMQLHHGRPFITLKLALSLDGCIALDNGASQWITGESARAHGHLERARSNMILVGRGTLEADQPRLDVRLAGLEHRSPQRAVLTRHPDVAPPGWIAIPSVEALRTMADVQYLMVEGGAQTAAALLKADLVDRLMIYRAPILLGGRGGIADLGLDTPADAHGRWNRVETRTLGSDTLDVYDRRNPF
jgi:diaminohydroxyphosphoribosylaminopyrimidine deaminase/5-amino-6-(5-phosphoribosylamino)uracil reductase